MITTPWHLTPCTTVPNHIVAPPGTTALVAGWRSGAAAALYARPVDPPPPLPTMYGAALCVHRVPPHSAGALRTVCIWHVSSVLLHSVAEPWQAHSEGRIRLTACLQLLFTGAGRRIHAELDVQRVRSKRDGPRRLLQPFASVHGRARHRGGHGYVEHGALPPPDPTRATQLALVCVCVCVCVCV